MMNNQQLSDKYRKTEPASALADAGSAKQGLFLQPLFLLIRVLFQAIYFYLYLDSTT